MGSWIENRTKSLENRIERYYDDARRDPEAQRDHDVPWDEIERAIRETVEEAARRAELGSCTPHPLDGDCFHRDCTARRFAAKEVRRMLEDEARDAAEVAGG